MKVTYKAHIRDMESGRAGVYESEWDLDNEELEPYHLLAFIWSEGSYGCDCNRSMFLDRALGIPEEEIAEDTPCSLLGKNRFVLDKLEVEGVDLVAKHGVGYFSEL